MFTQTDASGISRGDEPLSWRLSKRYFRNGPWLHERWGFPYMVFEDIGWAFYEVTGKLEKLDEAIEQMRKGAERLLDPQLNARLTSLERKRIPLTEKVVN